MWAALLVAVSSLIVAASSQAGEPTFVDVFDSGSEGYHTYRIPSLLVTSQGTLLAFCEGRKTGRGDHGDLDLVLRRSKHYGETWGPLELVYEEGGDAEITIGNPCPVEDRATGRIWLPFCRNNDDVLVTYSDDQGATWSEPADITADVKRPDWGWYATGPGVGIQLAAGEHAGRMVIPCDHREPFAGGSAKFSHCFYSDDAGRSWQLGERVAPHTDECQVVELADGRLLINMRNYWARDGGKPELGNKRAIATSSDGGHSWSELRFDETLIEPVCQASLITLPDQSAAERLLVFANPASKSKRHQLTVRMSDDAGESWQYSRLLYSGGAAYSCLARLPDGRIACLFERDDYRHITLATFTEAWIQGGD